MHEKEIFGSCAYGPHRPGAAAGGERRRRQMRQNLTWELNGTTLTISGSGDMYDYYSYEDPWGSTVETVVFSADMTSIGNYAFQGTGLTEVTIPEGVTKIGKTAFYNCVSLQAVSLPSTLKTIGEDAFKHTGLTSVAIPGGVTAIGASAFRDCQNLAAVTIASGANKSIKGNAFYDCGSLTTVTLGSGVTTIGNYAFQNCDLTEISIPASVTSIGDSAFYIIRIWRPSRSWTARTTQPSKNSLLKTAAV